MRTNESMNPVPVGLVLVHSYSAPLDVPEFPVTKSMVLAPAIGAAARLKTATTIVAPQNDLNRAMISSQHEPISGRELGRTIHTTLWGGYRLLEQTPRHRRSTQIRGKQRPAAGKFRTRQTKSGGL